MTIWIRRWDMHHHLWNRRTKNNHRNVNFIFTFLSEKTTKKFIENRKKKPLSRIGNIKRMAKQTKIRFRCIPITLSTSSTANVHHMLVDHDNDDAFWFKIVSLATHTETTDDTRLSTSTIYIQRTVDAVQHFSDTLRLTVTTVWLLRIDEWTN